MWFMWIFSYLFKKYAYKRARRYFWHRLATAVGLGSLFESRPSQPFIVQDPSVVPLPSSTVPPPPVIMPHKPVVLYAYTSVDNLDSMVSNRRFLYSLSQLKDEQYAYYRPLYIYTALPPWSRSLDIIKQYFGASDEVVIDSIYLNLLERYVKVIVDSDRVMQIEDNKFMLKDLNDLVHMLNNECIFYGHRVHNNTTQKGDITFETLLTPDNYMSTLSDDAAQISRHIEMYTSTPPLRH